MCFNECANGEKPGQTAQSNLVLHRGFAEYVCVFDLNNTHAFSSFFVARLWLRFFRFFNQVFSKLPYCTKRLTLLCGSLVMSLSIIELKLNERKFENDPLKELCLI